MCVYTYTQSSAREAQRYRQQSRELALGEHARVLARIREEAPLPLWPSPQRLHPLSSSIISLHDTSIPDGIICMYVCMYVYIYIYIYIYVCMYILIYIY